VVSLPALAATVSRHSPVLPPGPIQHDTKLKTKLWCNPTLVLLTSARKYGWLCIWRRSISPLSGDRTICNSGEIDPCTGRRRLQIFCWQLRTACLGKILIMPNGFGDSGLRCFWNNVQERFGRRERSEGKVTSNGQRLWGSGRATWRKVTTQSCQIHVSWLWFIECRMATMTRHPAINSMFHPQRWESGKSWLITSKNNCGPKEPHYLTATFQCNSTREALDEEYMELYAPGQMMNDLLYGHISFTNSLSNGFKLNLGHDLKLFPVEMKAATGKDIAEHIIRPAKVIPASLLMVSDGPQLISILGLWRDPMKMKRWWIRRQVAKWLTVVLM